MLNQIIRSIFPEPNADIWRRRFLLKTLVLHFRPASVPRQSLRFTLTWGLGGMAATLILIQFATGILLKFAYVPTPAAAYDSIQWIVAGIPFGRLIRNLHHWCSHLLVAVAVLHLLRVFFTGAFHPPRQFNWIVGLCLLGTVLMANFTGYLLPWDQLAYWAVTVSTGMLDYVPFVGGFLQEVIREGSQIGPAALRIFYSLHTAVVPVALAGLMAFHFWRVRKARGVVIPRLPNASVTDKPERVPSTPDLLLREIVVALVLAAAVLMAAAIYDAPLSDPANPGLSPNPTRAPWYFAGLQELLLHLHPVFAVCLIPILAVCTLLTIPYWSYPVDSAGIWFASRTGRTVAPLAVAAGVLLALLLILVDEWLGAHVSAGEGLASIAGKGVLPTVLLAGGIAACHMALRRRFGINRNEAVQSIFILLCSTYGILTLTGIWFRGAGMQLALPW